MNTSIGIAVPYKVLVDRSHTLIRLLRTSAHRACQPPSRIRIRVKLKEALAWNLFRFITFFRVA